MGTVCRVLGPLRTVPAICGCFQRMVVGMPRIRASGKLTGKTDD